MGGRGATAHHGARVFGVAPNLPNFRRFATQYEAIRYHESTNFDRGKWGSLLTDEEREGIRSYTGSAYSSMNTPLREDRPVTGTIKDYIDHATTGLGKLTAADDVVVFRGANAHWTANLLEGTEAQLSNPSFLRSRIGKVVTDKGFMSTGTHSDSAWSSDVMYTVYVRKGTKGMYVDPISINSGEYEFLINRNTAYRVHMIKTDNQGMINELVLETVVGKKK